MENAEFITNQSVPFSRQVKIQGAEREPPSQLRRNNEGFSTLQFRLILNLILRAAIEKHLVIYST
jgi:hypothetical protein